MKIVVMTCAAAAILAVVFAFRVIYRVKKQLAEMTEALSDVKKGNGNRRILAEEHELTAPLAYAMNDIIRSYEDSICACHRAEEMNRQLMTSLSHDARTPLTTLIGYLDAVHRGIVTGTEREKYMETARRKAYDLKEYIDELFDWFKLNSGEFAVTLSAADAGELTRIILADWIPVLETQGLDYGIDIPERPFPVMLDGECYRRILNNLVQNVIAHSGADRLELFMKEEKEKLVVCLSDNGNGMDSADVKHIFERLYKCDKGRSEKGSGLGLSIVQQLITKMNGSIEVESAPGKGSSFYISFPLSE